MATRPDATVTIQNTAAAFSGGTGYAVVLGCVGKNADLTPRVYSSPSALIAQHDYSDAADLAALIMVETKAPVVFVGMPDASVGALRWSARTGTGTSIVTVSAGTYGIRSEVDAILTVTTAGTIGSGSGPVFDLSLDGGRNTKAIRLGTASSYTIPYMGIVLSFAAGSLVVGDTFSFRTTAPMWDSAALTSARVALAAQQRTSRAWYIVGDLPTSVYAGYITTQANAYETSNKRFVYVRAQVRDGGTPSNIAKCSQIKRIAKFGAADTLTFAEVGVTGDTITRSAGSWITDGFAVGDVVTVAGSTLNNVTGRIAALSATVLTFDTTDLAAEGPTVALGTITVVGSNGIVFAEVGATGDTITRNAGSWITEGFAVGDIVTITGTASNNVTTDALAGVTATVLTLGSTDLTAEEIGSHAIVITKVLAKAVDVALADAAFVSIDAQKRIDLGYGRARKQSPITGWSLRRPIQWGAAVREIAHDVQIPCWRVADGPLDGWDLEDAAKTGIPTEYDERNDGGALAARFTCATTLDNGPAGAFVALSLTRDTEGSILSRTHNLAVANLGCAIVQAETTNAIGQVLILNANGTGTEGSLKIIEARVNKALGIELLQQRAEGQRASSASWAASRSDILNVPSATMNGVLSLLLNGTLEHIATSVVVQQGG